jgi:2-isopropylmalate synthase
MEVEFSQIIQKKADQTGLEMTSDVIWDVYEEVYLNLNSPFELVSFDSQKAGDDQETIHAVPVT